MSSIHERIQYPIDESREVYTTEVYAGSITTVNDVSNTADVQIDDIGFVANIPIFYHCPRETDIDNGYRAFRVGDRVLVVASYVPFYGVTASNTKVVGFEDGETRKCHPGYIIIMAGLEDDSSNDTRLVSVYDPVEQTVVSIPGVSFPCAWTDTNLQDWLSSYSEATMPGIVTHTFQEAAGTDFSRVINYQAYGDGDYCDTYLFQKICHDPADLTCAEYGCEQAIVDHLLFAQDNLDIANCNMTCNENSASLTEQIFGLDIGEDSYTFSYYSAYSCSDDPDDCCQQIEHSENYYDSVNRELRWESMSNGQETSGLNWATCLLAYDGSKLPFHMKSEIDYDGSHDQELGLNAAIVSKTLNKSRTVTYTPTCQFGELSALVRILSGAYSNSSGTKSGGHTETGDSTSRFIGNVRSGGYDRLMFTAYYKANVDMTWVYDYATETSDYTYQGGVDVDVKAGLHISDTIYTDDPISNITLSANFTAAIKNNIEAYFSLAQSLGILQNNEVGADKYKPMYFKLYR